MPRIKHTNKKKPKAKAKSRPTSDPATTLKDDLDSRLRPQTLDEYVGQARVVEVMRVMIAAARIDGRPIRHSLFHGPPGLGKTTLARCVARAAGTRLIEASAPAMSKLGDLVGLLTTLETGDVLFIDEIHRMPIQLEETLYGAMEGNVVRWMMEAGPMSKAMELPIPPWTLLGATTRVGLVSGALLERFAQQWALEPYADNDVARILETNAKKLGLDLDVDVCGEIAQRSRGVPRIANQCLCWVHDVVASSGYESFVVADAREALDKLGVDSIGLDSDSQRYLAYLGGRRAACGVKTISAYLQVPVDALESVVEPYMLRCGLIERTSKGRVITSAGRAHLRLSR